MSELREYVKAKYPDNHLKLGMFAYYSTKQAPVTGSSDTGYALKSEDLAIPDDIFILLAPIYADYSYDFYYRENMTEVGDHLLAWTSIAKNVVLWQYGINFKYFLYPYDNYNAVQKNLQIAYSRGVYGNYDQNQNTTNKSGTGFLKLRIYLNTKLMWNVNSDMNELLDTYFENQFGAAAPYMRNYFDRMRELWAYNRGLAANPIDGTISKSLDNKVYWPKEELYAWKNEFEKAFAAIEEYKTSDPDLYEKLYAHIDEEYLSVTYLLATLYENTLSVTELNEYHMHIKSCSAKYGIVSFREGEGALSDLFAQWAI